jgi:metallophosphoesterase (TIGR03767 family)
MSRRNFIRSVSAVGATVPVWVLASACASDEASTPGSATTRGPGGSTVSTDRRTTLDATIALAAGGGYRQLVWGPGEPFLVRDDLGAKPGADRKSARRSVLYFGHLSDTHLVDAQTPARTDWSFGAVQLSSAFRAQETLTAHVLAEMVTAVNSLNRSVVTGAPCAVSVITGDLTDSPATTELDWFLGVLSGKDVVANSGKSGEYEGVQAWEESTYAYHPDDPSKDLWGQHGYPAVPGMLKAAVTDPVRSPGLRMPWLSVLGNHDAVFVGAFGRVTPPLDELAVGSSKLAVPPANMAVLLDAVAKPADPEAQQQLANAINQLPTQPGVRQVTPDPARKAFTTKQIIDAHFTTADTVGPKGHGFTEASRTTGDAWWTWQVGPVVRFIGLDTNNQYFGADGSLPHPQWEWLDQQLRDHSSRYLDPTGAVVEHNVDDQLLIVLSHHTSWTMGNTEAAPGDSTTLHTGDELVELLLRYPNVIAWVNGHTHVNTIKAHPPTSSTLGGGFWEINTPSCIDWGQQSRMIEVVDNRDGTLSIFTLAVDHAAPPQTSTSDLSQQNLASLSREMSANPWFWDAAAGLGTPQDRNTELLVRAPFDLSKIGDGQLENHALTVSLRELAPGHLLPV